MPARAPGGQTHRADLQRRQHQPLPARRVARLIAAGRPPGMSTAELRRRLSDPDLTIVDVRPLSGYNGWRLGGEARGGHIPGAVPFPSSWLSSVEEAEVERLLRSKGITAAREVVLYGGHAEEVAAVRMRLVSLGQTGVRTYEHGWSEWAADRTLPVERLPNYDKLVHAEWLRQLLAGGRPEASPAGAFLLFHVNSGVVEEYEEDHIPGALYLDTNRLEDSADWNRRSPQELEAALLARGQPRHGRHPLWPRHRRRSRQEVARSSGRAERSHPGGADLALRGRRRRPPARRRLRLLGAGGQPARDGPPRARAGRLVWHSDPAAAGADRRH